MNTWLWIPSALVTLSLLMVAYRFFGRSGLYAWIAMATVVANIQVTQQIEIGGVIFTLGNIVYGTLYLATDILNEKYGRNAARKGVWLGFFILITTTVLMQIALLYVPFNDPYALAMNESLASLFSIMPMIVIGSLAAYLVSQLFDVFVYSKIRAKTGDKKLWLRTSGSTVLSQLLDTLTFCVIAFWGMEWDIWWNIFISTYVAKFIIAWMATPFMYYAKKATPSKEFSDKAA